MKKLDPTLFTLWSCLNISQKLCYLGNKKFLL